MPRSPPAALGIIALFGIFSPAWASASCGAGQYQSSALVLSCDGGSGSMSLGLKKAEALSIGSFPVSTRDVAISLSATVDFDMQLLDTDIGMCIAGFNCQHQTGCQDESDYCISYKTMDVYFSGDDEDAPVKEAVKIRGALTTPMDVAVFAQAVGTGTVEYSYSALVPCPEPAPGCSPCADYTGCLLSEDPVCDGTPTVLCVPKPTTTLPPTTEAPVTEAPTTESPSPTPAPTPTSPPQKSESPCTPVNPDAPQGSKSPSNPCTPSPPEVGTTKRPSVKHVMSAVMRNISTGAVMVGKDIQHSMIDDVNKMENKVYSGVEHIREKVNTGLDNMGNKVNNGLDHVRQKMVNGMTKVDKTLIKIKDEMSFTPKPSDFGPAPTWPPSWTGPPSLDPTWPPAWKGTNIMGKEQALSDTPADRAERHVPLAAGSWIMSLFSSWSSPGSLFALWLVAMASVLIYFTGFRFCALVRKRVKGSYAQVSPPAAATRQSRDVFTPREITATLPADVDVECEGASRGCLLREELE